MVIERTNKHTTARLEHNTGKTVVSVSTRDWDARQVLGKTNDLAAMKILGKMFAARCLMAGFLEFHSGYDQEIRAKSEKASGITANSYR
jgi:ribosomal protein L18